MGNGGYTVKAARKVRKVLDTSPKLTLEDLEHMSTDELRAAWARLMGRPPLRIQSREFLLMSVAWEFQARQFGGLRPAARRKLESLAASYEAGESARQPAPRPRYRPGTVLTKTWHSANHTITVLENGYAYQGTVYKSLSEIARVITGTRWNGPRFFGLRSAKDRTPSNG